MPKGTALSRQWPDLRPEKRENNARRDRGDGDGALATLVGQLMPSVTPTDTWSVLAEVQRQFSLPRLPVPTLGESVARLLGRVHPTIASQASEALRLAVTTIRADTSWRVLRMRRLWSPRPRLREEADDFVSWLGTGRADEVERGGKAAFPVWWAHFPPEEQILRLARLRPPPLELLWLWHESKIDRWVAGYEASHNRMAADYVISACLQRLDAYYVRKRIQFRRMTKLELLGDPLTALHVVENGQLTMSDAVFDSALSISEGAVAQARVELNSEHAKPMAVRQGTEGSVLHSCDVCLSGAPALAKQPKLTKFPPFVLGCTCHFSFAIEGSPLKEAKFNDELALWARHRAQGRPFPHPSRLLLFKLAEASDE